VSFLIPVPLVPVCLTPESLAAASPPLAFLALAARPSSSTCKWRVSSWVAASWLQALTDGFSEMASFLMGTQFVVTYLGILGTTTHPEFTLIVPSYAQYFNPEPEICDAQFLFYGRHLTREFRTRINRMVTDLNLIIQIAVSMV